MFSFLKHKKESRPREGLVSSFLNLRPFSRKLLLRRSNLLGRKDRQVVRKASIGAPQTLNALSDSATQSELSKIFRLPSRIDMMDPEENPYYNTSGDTSDAKSTLKNPFSEFPARFNLTDVKKGQKDEFQDPEVNTPKSDSFLLNPGRSTYNRVQAIDQFHHRLQKQNTSQETRLRRLTLASEALKSLLAYVGLSSLSSNSAALTKASELLINYSQRTLDPLVNVKRPANDAVASPVASPVDTPGYDRLLTERLHTQSTSESLSMTRKSRREKFELVYNGIKQKNSELVLKSSSGLLEREVRHLRLVSALDPIFGDHTKQKKRVPESLLEVAQGDKYHLLPEVGLSPLEFTFDGIDEEVYGLENSDSKLPGSQEPGTEQRWLDSKEQNTTFAGVMRGSL